MDGNVSPHDIANQVAQAVKAIPGVTDFAIVRTLQDYDVDQDVNKFRIEVTFTLAPQPKASNAE